MTSKSLTMDAAMPVSLLDRSAQDVVGKPTPRYEGPLKVSGRATYAAEYPVERLAHGYLVRATIGAGKIRNIDAEGARGWPGVIDVITDWKHFLRNAGQGGSSQPPRQGVTEIAYMGEPIALVVAESYEAARDAALRIRVDYDQHAGRFDFAAHRTEGETPPPGVTPPKFSQGDLDAAMAAAPVTLDVTYTTPSQNSAAMEPHASTAVWSDDGKLTLYGAYQMPSSDQTQLALSLRMLPRNVRIVSAYVGGGFGSKLGIAPESVAAALAARKLGRPVKVAMPRQQVFETTPRRSNTEQRIRFAAESDGALTGIGHDGTCSNLEGEGFFEPTGIGTHALYRGEHRSITHEIVRLNLGLSGSMRAPGEAVGMIAIECAMDQLAEKLGIDPVELRKRNDPAVDPEKNVPYSSRQLSRCLDEGAAAFGWDKRNSQPGQVRDGEWLVGVGMAAATRNNQMQASAASVRINAAGHALVQTSMTDIGTGTYTILQQIAAELLGLPLDRVSVELGDTEFAKGAGSGGSWGATSSGSSVYLACESLREQIAKKLDVAPEELTLKDGMAIAANRVTPLADLVGEGLEATGEISPGKQETLTTQASYGAHFCEVGVNTVTGEARVRRYLGVFDAGRILNARTARSQILGGIVFGIGAALSEEMIHDPRTGKLVNRDLAEYHVPVNADVPEIDVRFVAGNDIHANPLGAKGVGELGISGAAAAIANAIHNACGVRVTDFPITCDKLLAGLPTV